MHRPGHVGAALLSYAPLGAVAIVAGFQELALVGAGAAVLLVMLPDWDQRVPLIKHRGVTHTAAFALLVGLTLGVAGLLAGLSSGPLAGVSLGVFTFAIGAGTIASHVAADALTPAGVRPWWPLSSQHYSYDVARASSLLANYALLVLGGGVAGLAFLAALAVV